MASANTLTNLIPTLHKALNTVSREATGMIGGVYINAEAEEAAKDQTISYPIVEARAAADITPAATGPNPDGETVGAGTMTISKSRSVSFPWNGEEQRSLGRGQYNDILTQQFAQAMRTLANEVEVDLAALYKYASRAVGTAGTTPFATTLADSAAALKVLIDNGAPRTDLQMAINTTTGVNMRGLTQLTDANRAGNDLQRRTGILLDVNGFMHRESAGFALHTKGTGANYVTSGATAAGVEDIALITGTGTVLAGDVVTFAADTVNKYVVGTGVAAPGTISLNKPGARVTIADANALTIGNSYTPNLGFDRNAIHLVARLPVMPEEGDIAEDVITLMDEDSGLMFQIALYRQYRQVVYEVALAWGVKAVKPEHMVLLMG